MSALRQYAYTQFLREQFCPSITAPASALFRYLPRKGEVPDRRTKLDIMKGCVIFRLYNCGAEDEYQIPFLIEEDSLHMIYFVHR